MRMALMGMPMSATPIRQSAVSRHVVRRFRAWAAKKASRSAGPGTGRHGRSVSSGTEREVIIGASSGTHGQRRLVPQRVASQGG